MRKTAPASEFAQLQEAAAAEHAERQQQLHTIWRRVRQGCFVLPTSVCKHDAARWEIYDAGLAGCMQCGAQHVCSERGCNTEENEQGQRVCTLTGLCVRELAFSKVEYVDTTAVSVQISQSSRQIPAALDPILASGFDHIRVYVRQVLCSNQWSESINLEISKLDSRRRSLVCRAFKDFKSSNPGILPVIPDIVSQVASLLGSCRKACRASEAERDRIARWCSDTIFKHICLLNSVSRGAVSECRLKGCTVGLLYLMRQGIVMHGVVVLPKLHRLREILPVENHLHSIFGIKGKCITETENTVKMVMKSVGRESLKTFGVSGIDTALPCGK